MKKNKHHRDPDTVLQKADSKSSEKIPKAEESGKDVMQSLHRPIGHVFV
jgi:hypothetical protein